MSDTECEVMRRPCLAPFRKEVANITAETDSRVCVSCLGDVACDRNAFRRNHLEFSVAVYVYAKHCDRSCFERELYTYATSGLSVVFFQFAESCLSCDFLFRNKGRHKLKLV